jgi:fused signal recognition particle receptor
MFSSLKNKLKSWVKKTEEGNEIAGTSKKEKFIKKNKKTENSNSKEELKDILEKPSEGKFYKKFKKRLTEEKFEDLFEELELILLQNNVAYNTIESIKNSLSEKLIGKTIKEVNLSEELKNSIEAILIESPDFLKTIKDTLEVKRPFVIILAGINGSGKTTTTAKLANYLLENNLSVSLAAADTFRAASIEQLQEHANNLKIHLTKKDYGSDPASVGFEAISYAKKNKIDVVLIDTAGRMQNKDSLMNEIEKIVRVSKPDMKIFLGESITGNGAIEQASAFNEKIGITGIILSKTDVDEKGGTALSVSQITGKPILFLGTGQEYRDLEKFDKKKFIKKLEL